MTFTQLNLNSLISKAIHACGYTKPTPIQARSIPVILDGKDLLASAQTGTGKTAAFVLPMLHRLSESKSGIKARALILTPTRELANQITQATYQYGKFSRLKVTSVVGGMPYRQQLRNLSNAIDIIVATPGRLLDHMENRKVDLSNIEMLILDEADRMLDMGFIDDIKKIVKKIPDQRQTLLFSATVDNRLSKVINEFLRNPVRIDLASEKIAPVDIEQKLYLVDNAQHKIQIFQELLQDRNIYKAIIFSATKVNADRLARQLREQKYLASALHGDMKQGARNRIVEQLRRNNIQFLVATDVASRGIDIADVSHVINFDLPKFSEDYVHRIGRTGRAGKTGVAISLALPSEARQVQRIERFTKQPLQLATIEGLEPTQRFNKQLSKPNKKKKYGKSRKKR